MDYPLAPVRDGRARDERAVQGELADAVGDAARAAAELEAADRRIAEAATRVDAAVAARAGLSDAGRLALADRYLARLRVAVERAQDERDRLAAAHAGKVAEVDAARDRLKRARGRRELVERHFARWRAERRKLAQRREE